MKFIVIEGPEGSGKSTLLTNIQQRVPNSIVCKRPAKYREKILNSKGELRAAFWLFRDFLESDFLVRELLKTKHVFMDRYTYSTYLYQSYLLGINPKTIEDFYEEEGLLEEDLLIYVDEDFSVCQQRLSEKVKDRFEQNKNLQRDMYNAYESVKSRADFVLDARGKNLQEKINEVLDFLKGQGI